MQGVCRLWIVLLYISYVFLVPLFQTITCLSNIKFTCNTCDFVNPTAHIFVYIIFVFDFVKLYVVLVLRKAIVTAICLNKLLILCTNVNVVQVSEFWVVLPFWSVLFNLCCNCEFGFWISVRGKFLASAVYCIVVYSFCFVVVRVGASACVHTL